ncbi:MAG: LysM peptidoglycan-binding domain-containing protein [Armatimonadetes bacterium]|nr:LysM peptidoglycan-binding domain-containing protein [Armatimonadota bacterium]
MSTQTPPTAAPTPPADSLARQLRVLKALVGLLALALTGGVGYYLYQRHLGQPVTILVGGKRVATVLNAATADRVLAEAERAKVGAAFAAQTPLRLQKIQFLRAPAGVPADADAVARQKLMGALKLRVHASVIVVNGRSSIGLPDAARAQQTLEAVKDHFAQMPPQAQVVGEPQIVEKVAIVPKVIDTARARSTPEAAAPYFWTPPSVKTYMVQRGDTGFRIAARNHISFTDFLTANPGKDLNKLRPGDTVNVQKMPLLLTVRVKKTFTRDEPIVAHAPPGEAGLQRVTYVVTYLNGQETKRDVTNMDMLDKPRTQLSL